MKSLVRSVEWPWFDVRRYDLNGSNFRVALRLALTSLAFDEDEEVPAEIAQTELPDLPGELCGIWAYIKWEVAGCPQRSQQESDAEYQKTIEVWPTCRLPLQQSSMVWCMSSLGPGQCSARIVGNERATASESNCLQGKRWHQFKQLYVC